MGRSLMIPGYLGSNIEGVLHPERKNAVNGHWETMPASVAPFGKYADEIFAGYHDVEKKIGKDEMQKIPYGAIAMYTLCDKLSGGLQQLMAGARRFSLSAIDRTDIYSANRETERESGIAFITEIEDAAAKAILNS